MSGVLAMPADRRVTWMELFFDLVFVAAVSQVGIPLAAHFTFHELGRFTFLLLLIWWAWHGYALYATRFETDDTIDRWATLLQMVAVIFMAANAEEGLDSQSSAGFAAAYGVMRLILAARYLRAAVRPATRRLAVEQAAGLALAALVWIGSALLAPPARYGWWAVAVTIDLATAVAGSRFAATVPPHAAHLPERFGLFTLILLGEAIVAIMTGVQRQPHWSGGAALSALTAVAMVCAVWWIYFHTLEAAGHRHVRCPHDARRLIGWSAAHFPLYLGVAIGGLAAEHAVRAGGWAALHDEEAGLFAVAVVLVAGALWAVHATRRAAGCCA